MAHEAQARVGASIRSDPRCSSKTPELRARGFSRALRQASQSRPTDPVYIRASERPRLDLLIGADGTLPWRSRLELRENLEPDDVWQTIRSELRQVVGESTYE